tara:strand:- start:2479 stop:4791 length:2313 start_codon:yes stop_codon:yes gene_type:complete
MNKKVDRIHKLFEQSNTASRSQWEYINQKGYDFSNDNQLTEEERQSLQEQGMPDFTINRIIPVVEMLNYYATAKQPRWQAIGAEGSDIDIATVFSDIADYIWYISDGPSVYSNAINDSITKSVGYLQVTVAKDSDRGMGDVVIKQPDPFDIYVDPKSRDILFRDAAFVTIRKILPRHHIKALFPEHGSKVNNAASINNSIYAYSEKSQGRYKKDFSPKDISESESVNPDGDQDDMLELFEVYEKVKEEYMNMFILVPPADDVKKKISQEVKTKAQEMQKEFDVQLKEKTQQFQMAVQSGQMLEERMKLEIEKLVKQQQEQIVQMQQQMLSDLMKKATKQENIIMAKKQFEQQMLDPEFKQYIQEAVPFYKERIKLTCAVGDKLLYEYMFPDNVEDYPIVPFHYKWTGTPFPISAVSPLVGKQREINKSHQLMVHNASLGSSLRWMHEEGSIDTDYWEKYSSSPGALLPIRPGAAPPTPVQPAPLSNAFFTTVQQGKGDMEYLAGIYSSMQGDTQQQHETFRGMLAMDEYGTRRIKQWMTQAIEPGLRQLGKIVMQFSQAIYTANKTFRIIQPSAIQEERSVEINVPMYNDMGVAIGKFKDYSAAKFDVRVVSGSTLPVNRWAYLDELKQLMQLGIVDDIAVLAETDIKNKENIAKRKSLYSQLQGRLGQMEESIKDKDGTIETLERQLVQAGIKMKVNQAEIEINKKKEEVKSGMNKELTQTQGEQKLLRGVLNQGTRAKLDNLSVEAKDLLNKIKLKEKEKTLANKKKD